MDEEQTQSPVQENNSQFQSLLPIGVIGLVAVVGIGFFALRGQNRQPQESQSQQMQVEETVPAQNDPAVVEGVSDTDEEVRTIQIEAGAFYYNPKEIKATKGEKLAIVLTSKDMMHDFNIDELNVKSAIAKSGETVTVEFVASEAGVFEYYCSVGQHRKNGQVGKLIVE